MMRTVLGLGLAGLLVAGCSTGTNQPVDSAAIGQNRVSLANDPAYAGIVGRTVTVPANSRWTLRQLDSGRLVVQITTERSWRTQQICPLAGRPMTITDVFEDSVSGWVYYAARVQCADGRSYEAPLNAWTADVENLALAGS